LPLQAVLQQAPLLCLEPVLTDGSFSNAISGTLGLQGSGFGMAADGRLHLRMRF
jgi:hypothetical protein